MKKENLQKSIVLLGPSCVGKSLLSGQLSEELGLPVVCVDDVFAMAEYEQDGLLSKEPRVQNNFKKRCFAELEATTMAWTLEERKHKNVVLKQIDNIVNMYNKYHEILGGYDQVKKYLPDYDKVGRMGLIETVCYYNHLTLKVLKMLLKKIDTPVILDVPGYFGWEIPMEAISPKVQERFKTQYVDIDDMQKDISSILSSPQTILLEPGQDYQKRNAATHSSTNNMILKYLENYLKNAKIQISTNDLFYNPENKYFKQRRFIDAREAIAKDELKNKCEINNICHQILEMLDELSLEEKLDDDEQQEM